MNIGIVGLGLGRYFVAACDRSDLVDRIVVCDPDEDLRTAALATPKVSLGYASIEEMLAAGAPDAVCVVTPDNLHRPHVEVCLAAGCHVLMTKPLATNLDDARAIVRASENSRKTLMVAHERRFRSRNRAIKNLLDEGHLGEIILVQANQVGDRRGQFARAPWYASAEAGRSAIVGSGIHELDLVRFLVGQTITTVSAASNGLGHLNFPKSKTTATVLQFAGGAIGQTAICYEAHWPKGARYTHHFLLVASRGVVLNDKVKCDDADAWEDLPSDDNEITTGVSRCVDAFLSALIDGNPVPVTARDAYATLAACIAADKSAASAQSVVPDAADFI